MSDVRSFLHTQIKKSLLHTSARHGNKESEGREEGCVVKSAAAADEAAGPPRPN